MPLDAPTLPPLTRILAIANQKGGVGKTTTAVNLATALAACGKRVLLFDGDPQGNASTGFGIDRRYRKTGAYQVLTGAVGVVAATCETAVPGLAIVTSSPDLAGAEFELIDERDREYRLRAALAHPLPYDYILIDCPPSLGLLTLNALVAADALLVPLQCEFYALEGLGHLLRTIERIKKSFNPKLVIQGIVLTMYDKRNNLADLVASDVREHMGKLVYQAVIPRNIRVSEAPSHGKPVLIYDLKSPGSQAYLRLAREILQQEAEGPPQAAEGPDESQDGR